MVDTAGTLCEAARSPDRGGGDRASTPRSPIPVLSGPALKRIAESPLDQVIVTDTIPLRPDADRTSGKLHVVSVAAPIGEAIRRINNEESVSSLCSRPLFTANPAAHESEPNELSNVWDPAAFSPCQGADEDTNIRSPSRSATRREDAGRPLRTEQENTMGDVTFEIRGPQRDSRGKGFGAQAARAGASSPGVVYGGGRDATADLASTSEELERHARATSHVRHQHAHRPRRATPPRRVGP